MHYKHFQDVINSLLERGIKVFRTNDIAKLLDKSRAYASLMASRSREIKKIENGKYYLKGADINEIASNIIVPSYVSLLAALSYYDLTNQILVNIMVITIKRHKPLKIEGYGVDFVTINKSRFFGYVKVGNAYIARVEKAIIDSLYLDAVPYSELKDVLKEAMDRGLINIKILKDYAVFMHSKVLIDRLVILLLDLGINTNDFKKFVSGRKVRMLGLAGNKYDKRN